MLDDKYNSMDKEEFWKNLESVDEAPSFHEKNNKIHKSENYKTSDFGMGASMLGRWKNPVEGLAMDIRAGHGHIEFSPDAIGAGGKKDFAEVSAEERIALKELKKLNDVTLTVHANPGVTGLSGYDERHGFNESTRKHSIEEIRKAIDFASEVSDGGAITFHAGDFSRPIAGQGFGGKGNDFQATNSELDNTVFRLVDKEQGEFIDKLGGGVMNRQELTTPVYDYSEEGEKMKITLAGKEFKIPKFKEKEGVIQTENFKNFREYGAYLTNNAIKGNDKKFREELEEVLGEDIGNIKKKYLKKGKNNEDIVNDYRILEIANKRRFIEDQRIKSFEQASRAIGQNSQAKEEIKTLKKSIEKAKKESKDGENRYLPIAHSDRSRRHVEYLTERELEQSGISKNDVIIIEDGKIVGENKNERIATFYGGAIRESEIDGRLSQIELADTEIENQQRQQYEKLENNNYMTASEFAKEKVKESFAELGNELYAANKTRKKEEKLYFSIENFMPEKYGGSAEELIEVITDARKYMADALFETNSSMSKKEAIKEAQDSIKVTFDTSHLEMWKRHLKRRDGESKKDFDKRYNEWALNQTKKLIDSEMIGNIHFVDSFGFGHDHIAPGQGNMPLNEYAKLFDKAKGEGKIKGKVVIEGGFEGHGVHEGWKVFGAQIFKSQTATRKWVDCEDLTTHGAGQSNYGFDRLSNYHMDSYHKPYFMFGKNIPGEPKDWAPWSGTNLE